MTTFAFFPSPLIGHVNPTIGIARELVARGHSVTFHLPEDYRTQVGTVGAGLAPYGLETPDHLCGFTDPVTRFAMVPLWLTAECVNVLPHVLDRLAVSRPDVIVYDMLCVWGRLAAMLGDRPAAMVLASYVSNEHYSPTRTSHYEAMAGHLSAAFDSYAANVTRLSGTYGLSLRPRDLFARDERVVIVVMPRAFHPYGDTFDNRFVFIGASPRPAEQVAGTVLDRLEPVRQTLLVSFGTLCSISTEFVKACYEAFDDPAWQVLMVTGGEDVPAHAPRSFVVADWVPQLEVLRRADAFITHGGTNSVVEALSFGVPMVVLPSTPEHAITADRVAELRLGIQLDPHSITAGELRAAVDSVAAAPDVREALARMRVAVNTAGGPPAAAAALERLVPAASVG